MSEAADLAQDPEAISAAEDGTWTDVTLSSNPGARYGSAAIYDSARDRLLMFGGHNHNDVWALSLSETPSWTMLATTGASVPTLMGHTMIYDPVRDRAVVFGGYDDNQGVFRRDVWVLTLSGTPSWSLMTPLGSLPPASQFDGHSAIYDPVRDRMVVFAGEQVWSLSFSGNPAWSHLATLGSPQERGGQSAIYDPVRDRMVIFGGETWAPIPMLMNDVWGLPFPSLQWYVVHPTGTKPAARQEHTAIYDPLRDRMVVFGGDGTSDVWSLDLGNQAWKKLSPTGPSPGPYSGHTAIYDEVGGRMVVTSGGFHVPILTWASPVSAPIEAEGTTRVELASPRPNPARDETSVDFRLPVPAHVTLDVFDAQGRHVKRLAESWFTAGPHTRTWLGDDESGRAVRTGVYFVCMRAGESVSTRRTMRIR